MSEYPVWIIIIDYLMGAMMWTLVGRFGMSIFLQDNSDFFFMRVFVKNSPSQLSIFAPLLRPAF